MGTRGEARGTAALGAAVIVLIGVAAALAVTHPPSVSETGTADFGFAVSFAGLAVAGVVTALAQPGNRLGLLLVMASLAFVLPVAAGEYALHALSPERDWPLGRSAAWLSAWPPPLAYALLAVGLPLLFPTGRLPSARWRGPAWGVALVALLCALAIAVRPGALDGLVEIENPYGVASLAGPAGALAAAGPPAVSLCALVALVDLGWRYRRSSGLVRAQFRVVGLALAVLVVALLGQSALDAGQLASPLLVQTLRLVGFLAVPVALGVALTRYRLAEADRLVDRAVVYGLISAAVVVLYVSAVVVLGGAFGRRVDLGASVLAAGVAAVLFPLLRDGVQRLVARRLYGWRDDPYVVLSALGSRLDGLRPDLVLGEAVAALRTSLRLPWVAILDADGERTAAAGSRPQLVESLPLRTQDVEVGRLEFAPRSGERAVAARDLRLLTEVASRLAGAVRSAQLARDLQLSRERLVRAREEERRRLRRDLHDGVGPVLTGVVLGLDGVATLVPRDPEAAVALAGRVRADAVGAVDEIRRAVHGLRPPALDQLGLRAALEQRAAALSGDVCIDLQCAVLPDLPAAVEVACYAVAVEAMTNVVRHAGASACTVRLEVDGVLCLEVQDDGSGRHGPAGVGTLSSRERAAELGGTVEVLARPGDGTLVRLVLPLEGA